MIVFPAVRVTTWRVLATAVAAVTGAALSLNYLAGRPTVAKALQTLQESTGGWVQTPLVAGPIFFAFVGPVIFWFGRLRLADVGWRRDAIGPAVLITAAFWIAMQPALAIWISASGMELKLDRAWLTRGAGWFAGQLLARFFGNALLEEMVFRGFLLPQLYFKAAVSVRPKVALGLAFLGASAVFALSHIPNRLFVNTDLAGDLFRDQLELFAQAITYGAVFLGTRNILVCVGLHSLAKIRDRFALLRRDPSDAGLAAFELKHLA